MKPQYQTTRDGRAITLRLAVPDDAPALLPAIDSVARERAYFLRPAFDLDVETERAFIASAADHGNAILVATCEERIVGWVTLIRPAQAYRYHVVSLGIGVLADWRGVGIGRALLAAALQWATEAGYERVELGVRVSNTRAQHLYLAMGFQQEGYRSRAIKDELGVYDDEIDMAILLPARSAAE